jgi:hypothetical protein
MDTLDAITRELLIAFDAAKARRRWQRSATKDERSLLADEEAGRLVPLIEALGAELSPDDIDKFPNIRRLLGLARDFRAREAERLAELATEFRRREAKRRGRESKT